MELQKDNQNDKRQSVIPFSPDLFHNDREFYLAYRKIEHIVSAIFLVTGLIETDVQLKANIREYSLQCLGKIVALIGKQNVAVADLQSVASNVLHLSSLLDIGFWSGQVSQMNLSILQKEISSTYQTLNDLSTKYKNTYYISSSFFRNDQELLNETKDKKQQPAEMPKRQVTENPVITNKRQNTNTSPNSQTIHKGQNNTSPSDSKEHRREAMLNLLRAKSNLTVKDFTSVVPEYSEKTIQRELLALVEEGIIKKEGERRWSSYSLAT